MLRTVAIDMGGSGSRAFEGLYDGGRLCVRELARMKNEAVQLGGAYVWDLPRLVQAGIGLSFQPRSIADTLQNPNVYAKPIRDFSVGSYPCLVWHPGNYVSGCLKRFLPLFETDYLPEEPS